MGEYVVSKWWSPSTVAVVTGANKGIGYEIARILATEGFTTVVASRNTELGNAAVSQLKAAQPDAAVDFVQLDITDAASVAACAEALKVKYGRVDILVNNAGIAYKGSIFGAEEAATTMNCNLKGTRSISEAVLPLMPEGGRIVNLCSRAGMLEQLTSDDLKQSFRQPADADAIVVLADAYVEGIRRGTFKQQGYSQSMYGMSKIAEMSYTRWLASQVKDKGIAVYGCCPGYCVTDMTSGRGNNTAAQGADTPVWLALQPIGSIPNGELFGEREVVPW